MTNWSAVLWGFVVGIVAGLLAYAIPVVGHVGAGLIAGAVAGCSPAGPRERCVTRSPRGRARWNRTRRPDRSHRRGLPRDGCRATREFHRGVQRHRRGLLVAFVFALDSAIGGAVGSLFSSAGDAPTR